LVLLISILVLKGNAGKLDLNSLTLEATWTLVPVGILFSIAQPSLLLLCKQDVREAPQLSLKVVGNQWNWQRECFEARDHLTDFEAVDLVTAFDTPVLLFRNIGTRVLTARTDVLHSLGVPRLGVKLDASPGRIRATVVETTVPGLFIGSCYELCGRGHRAMPINVLIL